MDQDAGVRLALQKVLRADGYVVEEVETCQAARERFRGSRPDAVIASCRLSDGSPLDLLSYVKTTVPGTPCIVLADQGTLDVAVEALQKGAEQFLIKPVDRLALLLVLQRRSATWSPRSSRSCSRSSKRNASGASGTFATARWTSG